MHHYICISQWPSHWEGANFNCHISETMWPILMKLEIYFSPEGHPSHLTWFWSSGVDGLGEQPATVRFICQMLYVLLVISLVRPVTTPTKWVIATYLISFLARFRYDLVRTWSSHSSDVFTWKYVIKPTHCSSTTTIVSTFWLFCVIIYTPQHTCMLPSIFTGYLLGI